ncbi:DsbA family protein [Cellulomonas fengjieae]|uniref:Thioredoxin domain-containing protein n=1 Tax=Cellulomonas fengjieae TaxID=2819978 RepID=A0ABS3SDE1_9CELL|nr:thioredoxin domain-containing protein [Cellulomonas fengjieae]MBO3083773.1 thioredoxin domain-containing protein [Cellulomonas fengjieae]MBO3101478.1 thioredoxin domain-containing protein [Cellulomonas fengjieae]QVI64934.1 thioredoxin domain-containing protein [Cellulomonas fengjieae]
MTESLAAERHVYGNPDAPVAVLEFGDLECPYCRAVAPTLRELVDTSDGQVRLVWRHFPLFEVHPYALSAALAAEAAGLHGKFWEMHDELLRHQDRLAEADLRAAAQALGLDPSEVAGDGAQVHAAAVSADYAAGIDAGVRGTPTIFVEGTRFQGKPTLDRLREAVAAVR